MWSNWYAIGKKIDETNKKIKLYETNKNNWSVIYVLFF